ncbi:NAPDH-dependent diflavin reductase [Pseudocyphellaria aurata]|nr:NAPDH-dependent diflavin reductase [Pseudocyphellaria aurata]
MSINGRPLERSALITYGSETGNAQDFAEDLGRLTQRLRFMTCVCRLDAVELSTLSNYSIVIFSVSTTGQGDVPINARLFWKNLLRKKLSPTCLQDLEFTVFGLGDSSYPKFNWAARKIQKRLLQLGAIELFPRGEADEQHPEGLDASFVPWSTDLRQHLLARFPLAEGVSPIPDDVLLNPKWTVSLIDSVSSGLSEDHIDASLSPRNPRGLQGLTAPSEHSPKNHKSRENSDSEIRNLTVILEKNHRLTPCEHWQDVRHIVFTSAVPASYGPGDVLTIYPKNFQDDVNLLISIMQWTDVADRPIQCTQAQPSLESNNEAPPFSGLQDSQFTTLRILLTENLDFTAIPRRSFFSTIAHFTPDSMHKERLREFTKPDYIDELYDYTTRPRRSILEVLQEFDSVRIPWQWAVSVLPELRGRQFSIASGGQLKRDSENKTRFELLVAIVKYKTVIKKIREGVCTRYLAALPAGAQLPVTLQKGGLAITKKEIKHPVIMIGPGTGVAPIRSLLWERLQWVNQMTSQSRFINDSSSLDNGNEAGENILFFGCRKRNADYFFQDEWADMMWRTSLQVFTAFSRDQSRKIYVQDVIKEQADLVFRLIHKGGAIVYICGSSGRMPKGVRASLLDVFQISGGMNEVAADHYLRTMEKEGRYKQETW